MGFLDMTKADLEADEKPIFAKDEIVEMVCKDHREDAQKGNITLRCQVLSGKHSGKPYDVFVSGRNAKSKAQFAKAFWTAKELTNGKASLSRLVGRKFSVRSSEATKNEAGYTNQWLNGFKDLGEHTAEKADDKADDVEIPF